MRCYVPAPLRKTEVSFESCHVLYCGNAQLGHMYSSVAMHNLSKLGPTEILVSLSFFQLVLRLILDLVGFTCFLNGLYQF